MKIYNVDVAFEDTLEETLEAIAEAIPGLTWKVIEEEGPAGWPLVAFEVPAGLDEDFREVYGMDEEE